MDDKAAREFYADPANLVPADPGRRRKRPNLTSMVSVRFAPEVIEEVKEDAAVTSKQTCPRRMSDFGPWEHAENLDEWRTEMTGLAGQDKVGRSCSFCGSLDPDRFMALVREGWEVGPTDKAYKAYLGKPVTAEDMARRKAAWMDGSRGGAGMAQAIRSVGERDGKTAEQVQADLDDHWEKVEAPIAGASGQEAKFYYQHLSADQRREFVDLHVAGTIKVAYPGYFYAPPFFMTYATPET